MHGSDDVPEPILEVGDYVRLKDPYRPMLDMFYAASIERTLKLLVWDEIDPDEHPHWESADDVSLTFFEGREDRPSCLEFTHAMVAEVLTRYPPQRAAIPGGQAIRFPDGDALGPPRNVSLHLFNEHGIIYGGGHPTEPIKPEFVDYHVAWLVLIHKASDSWGNEYELDLAPAYDAWGFEEPANIDAQRREEADDAE